MWSRIKRLALPISVRLTVIYAVILSCILFFTSILTVTSLYYVLYIQADDDIRSSAGSVAGYLAEGNPVDGRLLEANLLVPGVMLQVFDEHNHLLITNLPYTRKDHDEIAEDDGDTFSLRFAPSKKRALQIAHIGHNYFFLSSQTVLWDGHMYKLHFLKAMSEQTHFLKTLVKSLLATNAFGLLIAVISGIYISRKILRPIRDITSTAKEIEINDLGRRINITGHNDELQELAKTFNHMLNRIQTGFEQQRLFVADASHELRTPITVISGYADMLDRWGKQDPAALNEGIGAIKSEASNMYGLIEKLLFLARTDQNKQVLNKTTVTMEPLIADIVRETRLIAPKHRIELQQNDPAAIYADPASIREMLRVFIENSVKYTPEGGTISIASQQKGLYLDIIIKDTGIGIPQEEQTKVFDRFYRVDKSRSKSTGGTGLGLSIARWIAEEHQSTILLDSRLDEGTTITVRIPLNM